MRNEVQLIAVEKLNTWYYYILNLAQRFVNLVLLIHNLDDG